MVSVSFAARLAIATVLCIAVSAGCVTLRPEIEGVVLSQGRPVARARIEVCANDNGVMGPPAVDLRTCSHRETLTTDNEGRFAFDELRVARGLCRHTAVDYPSTMVLACGSDKAGYYFVRNSYGAYGSKQVIKITLEELEPAIALCRIAKTAAKYIQ